MSELTKTILSEPISGPRAWVGADMSKSDAWLYRFPRQALDEIDRALHRIKAKNLALHALTRQDFDVPTLAGDLAEISRELEHGRGFVQLKGLPVHRYDEGESALIYWGIGTHLGRVLSQNARGDLLGHVRDEGRDIDSGDVRAYQTRIGQGFHTDIGADVVGLLCLQPAKSGGRSRVVSSMAVYNELLKRHPWYVGVLYNDFAVDWRGEQPPGEPPVYREPIYAYHEGRLSCRFAPRLIRSAQARTSIPLTSVEQEAIGIMEALAEELCFEIEFEPGDIQLINNYTVLHGRTGYDDHVEPERKRHLLRLWLTVSGARSLPPAFSNGRARGGVPKRPQS